MLLQRMRVAQSRFHTAGISQQAAWDFMLRPIHKKGTDNRDLPCIDDPIIQPITSVHASLYSNGAVNGNRTASVIAGGTAVSMASDFAHR